jgi:hypothetical protein
MPEKKKVNYELVGVAAFYLGLIIAVLLGFFPGLLDKGSTVLLLGILGVIVGVINVTSAETQKYILAGLAFLVAADGLKSLIKELPAVSAIIVSILENIIAFVAPALALVALKIIYDVIKSK